MVALVGEHAALKRQGRRWVGLCPFHQERSPSFSVNAEEGLYYCFGCQRSGDAITFVRETEHTDFAEAVRRLADRAGLTITEDAAASAERSRRTPLYDAMSRAVAWYHERLLHAPDAGAARHYLRSRGYDVSVVRQFQLGWAPDAWDELARHLRVPDEVLADSGLGFVNRLGRQQDAFRARVLFPIYDPSGRPIALGGRVLPARPAAASVGAEADPAGSPPGGPAPKYKNSQDGPLYAKRRVLYALNWAKHDVIASGEVVVCEGYTDVIGCFVAGLPRAVATCGTALGEDHFHLLANFARRIVLAYDADSAGRAGAGRVYEWERGHQVDVAVADLPPGSDPGDLARRDPDALRAAVAGARPFLQFRVDQVLGAADLRHPEGRARAAEVALAAVAEHPNQLVRDQYLMHVADHCQLDARSLRSVLDTLVADSATSAGERRSVSGARPRTGSPERGGAGGGSSQWGGAGVGPPERGGTGGGSHRRPAGGRPGVPEAGGGGAEEPAGARDEGDARRGDRPGGAAPDQAAGSAVPDQAAGPAAPRGPAGSQRRRAVPPTAGAAAGMEALRLAVHDPAEVADRLETFLFPDVHQRVAFDALLAEDELHRAIERAEATDPAAAHLLRRVAVEEPTDPSDSVLTQLVRNAARRQLARVEAEARMSPERYAELVAESAHVRLDLEAIEHDPPDATAAARLVAWLGRRSEENA